jgi:hypothetical protein
MPTLKNDHVTSLGDHFEGSVGLVAGNYTIALHKLHSHHRQRTDLRRRLGQQLGAETVQIGHSEAYFDVAGLGADCWGMTGR